MKKILSESIILNTASNMKNITWLVQTNNIDYRHVSKIWDAAKKYAKVEEAVVVPSTSRLDNDFDSLGKYVIPYGSVRLSKIGINLGWAGVYQNACFDNRRWIAERNDMLNADSQTVTIKELLDFDIAEKVFIRPTFDHKTFTGFVATRSGIEDLVERAQMPDNVNFNLNSKVSVSRVKEIKAEYRYFIVGRKVVTGSLYALHGVPMTQPVTDAERFQEAQEIAKGWLPHETCVMDLADTSEGTKVVEFNVFNSSGFYDHDVDAIVKEVAEWENGR